MRTVESKGNGGDQRPAADDLHHEGKNQRDQGGLLNGMAVQIRKKAASLGFVHVVVLLFLRHITFQGNTSFLLI